MTEKIQTSEAADRVSRLVFAMLHGVAADVAEVTQAMHDMAAGYSASASGSGSIGGRSGSTITIEGDTLPTSSSERAALVPRPDDARIDLASWWAAWGVLFQATTTLATLHGKYHLRAPRASDGRVMHELETQCSNCRQHGHRTGKAPKRPLCNFCEEKKRDHGHLPDKELLDLHGYGKRCTPEVIGLWLNRMLALAKEAEAKGKKARKAA